MGNVTDETKRNRNRKTEPGVAKPAGRMDADDLFADDTSDIDVPVYRKEKGATDSGENPRQTNHAVISTTCWGGRVRSVLHHSAQNQQSKSHPSWV